MGIFKKINNVLKDVLDDFFKDCIANKKIQFPFFIEGDLKTVYLRFKELDNFDFEKLYELKNKKITEDERHYLYLRGLMYVIPGEKGFYYGSKETGGGYVNGTPDRFEWKDEATAKKDYIQKFPVMMPWQEAEELWEKRHAISFDFPERYKN